MPLMVAGLELRVPQVPQVQTDLPEPGAQLVHKAHRELRVLRVQLVLQVQLVQRVQQVQPDHKEQQVLMVVMEL